MIYAVWVLNLVLSALNAWGCGRSWNETKHSGGVPHLMNWAGAVMSSSGFTWCYLVLAAFVGSLVPGEGGKPLLSPDSVSAVLSLGYLVLFVPLIGSGVAVTIHSWAVFYRRRSLMDGVTAGYNTFATIYNVHGAVKAVPSPIDVLRGFFKKGSGKEGGAGALVLILVPVALLAGCLTTYSIVRTVSRSVARDALLKES